MGNTQHRKQIGLLLLVYTVIKVLLSGGKMGLGYWFGSVAVVGDGLHDLTDIGSSFMIALSLYMMGKPVNREHPFGQARIEYVATSVIGVIILLAGFGVGAEALHRIMYPQYLVIEPVLIAVLVLSLAVQMGLILFFRRLKIRDGSDILAALTADAASDFLMTAGVLLAVGAQYIGGWQIDEYTGALVSLALLYTGMKVLYMGVDKLLGKGISLAEEQEILAAVTNMPGVEGAHDLIVHDYGPGLRFLSIHIEVDSRMNLLEAHHVADSIERRLRDKYKAQSLVHVDPRNISNPATLAVENNVRRLVAQVNPRWDVHDFFATKQGDIWAVHFDISVEDGTRDDDETIYRQVRQMIHARYPEYKLSIVVDRHYVTGRIMHDEDVVPENLTNSR